MNFTLRRLAVAAATALLVVSVGALASACDEPTLPDVEAQLVPPPGVPAASLRSRSHVVVRLEAIETRMEVAPGVSYPFWTFNNTVPGPLIRVHEGDTVEIVLKNSGSTGISHNVDLHAVNGPGGGAGATTVAPGETKAFTFKAMASGLFVYHCAAGIVADHIANGMYGAILVEPSGGLPKVDHEFYVGQSDIYTNGDTNDQGNMELDIDKLLAENPTYVVFNGNTKSLIGDKALQAKVGETVRIYFANGGPNMTSSFHVIGEIFDKAWAWGTLESPPVDGVQTISVPPGGATIVEFKVDVPGDYKLVDHAISRVSKGAVGTLHVSGDADPKIFDAGTNAAAASSHDMTPMTPAAGSSTPVASGTPAAAATPIDVALKDNFFEPKQFTVKAGTTVSFMLTNSGKVIHNMRIASLDGKFEGPNSFVSVPELISVGKTGKLEFKVPTQPGTYKFQCDVHPTEMTGTIVVQ